MKKCKIVLIILTFSSLTWAEEPIEIDSHFIGDKEQPAVSYFMPWQGPGSSADNLHRKEEDKYEKSIDTVDRDVMLRSMRI